MREFLDSPLTQAIIWSAVLLILIAVGAYVVGIFRGRSGEDRQTANQMLTNFREMHHRGDIQDSEFRTIRTVLGEQLQQELMETDKED